MFLVTSSFVSETALLEFPFPGIAIDGHPGTGIFVKHEKTGPRIALRIGKPDSRAHTSYLQ
jgi:hypothetical protein